jgi:hypothetical protein
MKRKEFISKATTLVGAGFVAPYLLPSGSLFAKNEIERASNVVMVVLGGGIRQQDSVLGRFLEVGQRVKGAGGNIMPNLFNGPTPQMTNTSLIKDLGSVLEEKFLINTLRTLPFAQNAMFFPEMTTTQTGHFSGLSDLLTGSTSKNIYKKVKVESPTIFDYLYRFRGLNYTDCWFINNDLQMDGKSWLRPPKTGFFPVFPPRHLNLNSLALNPEKSHDLGAPWKNKTNVGRVSRKDILIGNFSKQSRKEFLQQLSDDEIIKEFITETLEKESSGNLNHPIEVTGSDARTVAFAAETIKKFQPKFTTIHLNQADICHSNYTKYLNNLQHSDYLIAWLWQHLEKTLPSYTSNTILVIVPDIGRNQHPNTQIDKNSLSSFDHNDRNSQRIWSVLYGKSTPTITLGGEGNSFGRQTDIALTIADIFGIYDKVLQAGFVDRQALSQFRQIS